MLQWQPRHVLILPGDTIFRMDLSALLAFHEERNADITIALHSTEAARAPSFGITALDDEGRITQLVEKPQGRVAAEAGGSPRVCMKRWDMQPEKPFLASMGIYVFRTEVLAKILTEGVSLTDFGSDILPHARAE